MTAKEYLTTLTLDEKIRLLNGNGSWKSFDADGRIPCFFMSDGPHGLRKQEQENYADLNKSKMATCFPTASCVASSWNVEAVKKMAEAIADEALAENVNIVLGCGINIKRSPLCGRNFEYFSEDPLLAGTLSAAYISSMEKKGVGTSLKHFACNNQETRRQTSNSIIDDRTLHEIYLKAFELSVRHGNPASIMASYNRLNGEYTCCSKYLLTDVLRKTWGFKGIVISDWGACIDASSCVKNGMDLAMPDSYGYLIENIRENFRSGKITEEEIDSAALRILETAVRFENQRSRKKYSVDYNVQHEMALEIAEESAVLLENDGMFPLKKQKLMIVGELAEFMKFQGGGSSHITTAEYPNALKAFENLGFEVVYEKGYWSGFCADKDLNKKNGPLKRRAIEKLKSLCDRDTPEKDLPVLFFCGLTEKFEGEGFDRDNLDLPQEQLELLDEILTITKNVAVVSFSGSPVVFPFRKNVRALLHMYLSGEASGEAVASIVSGRISPSGRLAETFPLKVEDIPCHKNFALEDDNVRYSEGVFVGYRHYLSRNIDVEYEFGFGKSYTSFGYSDFVATENYACLKITNTGTEDSYQVVQIYAVSPESQRSDRPKKELVGFTKVFVKSGQTVQTEISFDEYAFCVYSLTRKSFVKIQGEYEIQLCESLTNVKSSVMIDVAGEELGNVLQKVDEKFYEEKKIVPHKKGSFTLTDSMGDMAGSSKSVARILRFVEKVLVMISRNKSAEDPAIKITLAALKENPLESLISTSGGVFKLKYAKWILRKANK